MAGSYNHVVDDDGNLLSNEDFADMIENLGDAYEMAEEMYGMIWWLAYMAPNAPAMSPDDLVNLARTGYAEGMALAQANKKKWKRRS